MKNKVLLFLGIKELFDKLYLSLSDCEGMCNICNNNLKMKCDNIKNNVK